MFADGAGIALGVEGVLLLTRRRHAGMAQCAGLFCLTLARRRHGFAAQKPAPRPGAAAAVR
jgi:hypothetical protein